MKNKITYILAGTVVFLVLVIVCQLTDDGAVSSRASHDNNYSLVVMNGIYDGRRVSSFSVCDNSSNVVYNGEMYDGNDFKGVYWGNETDDIWVALSGRSVYCYRYDGSTWIKHILENDSDGSMYSLNDGSGTIGLSRDFVPDEIIAFLS